MITPKDSLNREIRVGDVLIYPGRSGSQMWLCHMTITSIEQLGTCCHVHGYNPTGRRVTVKKLENTISVPASAVGPGKPAVTPAVHDAAIEEGF
jgi:hypothetical protein